MTTPATKPTTVSLNIQSADNMAFEGAAIFLLGSPKTGKTVLACTASAYAPSPLMPTTRTSLPDVLVLQFEPNGTSSALHMGLAPQVLDFAATEYLVNSDSDKVSNDGLLDWNKVRPALVATAQYVRSKPEIKIIVIDNLSAFTDMVVAHEESLQSLQKKDGYLAYANAKRASEWLLNLFRKEKKLIIGIAHTKAADVTDPAKVEARAASGQLAPQVPGLPAGTASVWQKASDAVIHTRCKSEKIVVGGEPQIRPSYRLMVTSSNKMAGGNRWGLSGERESHLGPIVKRFYPNL